jgi:hypothetical protein
MWDWDPFRFGQLIRLDNLVSCNRLRESDARMPSWQEVNSEFPELVYRLNREPRPILFVSHRWDAVDHPDPSGWQLRALIRFAKYCMDRGDSDACIWLDYMSLPQKPRSADEEVIFRSGLEHIRDVLSRLRHHILLVSGSDDNIIEDRNLMLKRGWILYETFLVRARNVYSNVLYERYISAPNFVDDPSPDYSPDLTSLVAIDRAEFIHAWFEKQKITCTNGSDLVYLSRLLHEELTRYYYNVPPPGIEFDKELLVSNDDMIKLQLRATTDLSSRFPNIFANSIKFIPATKDDNARWKVRFVYRPPAPPLDVWTHCSKADLDAMMIDAEKCISKMYPGLVFEIDSNNSRIRATLC